MRNGLFLEIIACTVADAVAAAQGGADRIELISHYEVGGLTPPLDLVREIIAAVNIPVRVMLRDQESFFVTAESARQALCRTARELNSLPIEGLVLGFLRHAESDGSVGIDLELLERVVEAAPDLRLTFHRASESLPDPGDAIELLKPYPSIDTLLTSGGPEPWPAKVARLTAWVHRAAPNQTILVGGGVYEDAISVLRPATPLRAYHIGQAVREGRRLDGPVSAAEVARIADLLASFGSLTTDPIV